MKTEHLLGEWQVDSLFRYYNGFTQRIHDGHKRASYRFLPGNKVREQKGQDYREYVYEWRAPDSLLYIAPDGQRIGAYQVLLLKADRLIMKKKQPVVFEGKQQERYEIRYFSKRTN